MNQKLAELFGYSAGIAALIGLVRFRSISQAYLPFILLMLLAISNEVITTVVIQQGYSNALNNNIYDLMESLLVVWLFSNWRLFERKKYVGPGIACVFATAWLAENFFISSINLFNSYFNILYSFVIVLMGIHMINRMFVRDKKEMTRNSCFLICIGFIVFFTYKLLIEIFWVYGLNASNNFRTAVYRIMTYVNLTVNLIYALAVIWIPRKQESILP